MPARLNEDLTPGFDLSEPGAFVEEPWAIAGCRTAAHRLVRVEEGSFQPSGHDHMARKRRGRKQLHQWSRERRRRGRPRRFIRKWHSRHCIVSGALGFAPGVIQTALGGLLVDVLGGKPWTVVIVIAVAAAVSLGVVLLHVRNK